MARIISDDALAITVIAQEAIGEPYEGKVAVGEVVLTRMKHKFQSDGTVAGTVLRAFAFSGMNTRDPGRIRSFLSDDDNPAVADCRKAWEAALAGSALANGADSYVNLAIAQPIWAKEELVVARIGRHTFLKLRGSN